MTGMIATDLDHGGRWTRLRLAGRDWLWHRDDPARATARPGDAFVDAGGVEECIPTVRGLPDHGAAWTQAWRAVDEGTAVVETPDFRLQRRFTEVPDGVEAVYRLTAEVGYRFVWAAHALLDLSGRARLALPYGVAVRVFPEGARLLDRPWPTGANHVTTTWPDCGGIPMHRLGPSDGTAIGAIAVDCGQVAVHDNGDKLTMALTADHGVRRSVALWRNLGGFPPGGPYRSIGVEPMLGAVFDLAEAEDDDAVTVPPSGAVEWRLRVTA
jgi:hypothetical protein